MAAFQFDEASGAGAIYFETGLTLGSLIEPILCVIIGVYITGAVESPSLIRILPASLFAAFGICLMIPIRGVMGDFDLNPKRPLSHPATLWFMRASHNWSSISRVSRAIMKHGHKLTAILLEALTAPPPRINLSPNSSKPHLAPTYRVALVHELVALSIITGIPVDEMGVVYDSMFETPTGYILLVVDVCNHARVSSLQSRGYRFTDPRHVAPVLAGHLSVTPSEIIKTTVDIPSYAASFKTPFPSGPHVGLLVVIPTLDKFLVMVPSSNRTMIPTYPVSHAAMKAMSLNSTNLNRFMAGALVGMEGIDGKEVADALGACGIGAGHSQIPVSKVTAPTEVLVLHREGFGRDSDDDGAYVSRVALGNDAARVSPSDTSLLLFTHVSTNVGSTSSFPIPTGFTLIDLGIFEAMTYPRSYGGRFFSAMVRDTENDLRRFARGVGGAGDRDTTASWGRWAVGSFMGGVGSVLGKEKEKEKEKEKHRGGELATLGTGSVLGRLTQLRSNLVHEISVELNSVKVEKGDCMAVPILSNNGTKGSSNESDEGGHPLTAGGTPPGVQQAGGKRESFSEYNHAHPQYQGVYYDNDETRRNSAIPTLEQEGDDHWEDTIFAQYGHQGQPGALRPFDQIEYGKFSPNTPTPLSAPVRSSMNMIQPRPQQQPQQTQPQPEIGAGATTNRSRRRTQSSVDTPDEQWQKMRWIKLFVNSRTVATGMSASGGDSA
ncbi:hypothetical protein HDV00_001656 [Rhizophlyctis rosea]|nr:hypothetical protein HDV00_001656 [Rhizophlyctis rosea]